MIRINLAKIKYVLSSSKMFLVSFLAISVINLAASIYKIQKCDECIELESQAKPVEKISTDRPKLDFILRHKFKGRSQSFSEFVQAISHETYSQIASIDSLKEYVTGTVNVQEFRITGLFWHDLFIFDFLDKLQDFSPGFLNITSVEINKFSKQIAQKPIMKLEVICKVFQRS